MFNTGARVLEILNLRTTDLRLQPPYQVPLSDVAPLQYPRIGPAMANNRRGSL
jgi:hypothetical protein